MTIPYLVILKYVLPGNTRPGYTYNFNFWGNTTSSPSGLSIDSITGGIDINLSATDTYTIEYTSSGICPGTASFTLTINNLKMIPNLNIQQKYTV